MTLSIWAKLGMASFFPAGRHGCRSAQLYGWVFSPVFSEGSDLNADTIPQFVRGKTFPALLLRIQNSASTGKRRALHRPDFFLAGKYFFSIDATTT